MAIKGCGEYCAYCRRELVAYSATHPTRDHVMPRSKGGRKTVWACTKCNNAKGNMLPEEWELFMLKFPEWWKTPGREAEGRKFIFAIRQPIAGEIPKTVPIAYPDDVRMQSAFDHVYRDRLWMLRIDKNATL